jgi:hypothetical protein
VASDAFQVGGAGFRGRLFECFEKGVAFVHRYARGRVGPLSPP